MSKGNFIKIYRSILEWDWYNDVNTTRLFIHFLLTVNFKDQKFRGKIIKRGCRIYGLDKLSKETNLSVMQIRTSLEKLKITEEITIKTSSQGSEIQLLNYDKYQSLTSKVTSKLTSEEQASNKPVTTFKESNKENKENKENNNKDFIAPSLEEFIAHAKERKPFVNIEEVRLKYFAWKDNDWKTGGDKPRKIVNWKSTLTNSLKFMSEVKSGNSSHNQNAFV